jgi:hypothetical protein
MLRATVDISAHGALKTSLMNPKRAYSAFIGGCRIASLIILTGGALVAVLGLWTNETRPSLATDPREGVIESPPVASEVAPSQVIDPNPTFFFGAGDRSNGYYGERPSPKPHQD